MTYVKGILERLVKAHARNKKPIVVESFHQEDMVTAKQFEAILNHHYKNIKNVVIYFSPTPKS